ncbi:gas vesicle protein [Streptomyces sp. WMMB 322]|uniref:gas vesicle protein n=1 Tax=Streptomyces sp. WMMB 322 TaxID=1286821 RepID=UPI0008239717|nr:gas vesicle protein [Streptomyces sp. WMMB 322]SCK52195.1 Gas vesicle protein [Streptomyces sp. WMMB 322]
MEPELPGHGFADTVAAGTRSACDGFAEGIAEENGLAGRQVALIDLLDRLLSGGAVLTGDLVLSIADVDLVRINLRAVIHSVTADDPAPW